MIFITKTANMWGVPKLSPSHFVDPFVVCYLAKKFFWIKNSQTEFYDIFKMAAFAAAESVLLAIIIFYVFV